MKRFLMTAAAMTLGTSALAWAPEDAKQAMDKPAANWSDKRMANVAVAGAVELANKAAWESVAHLSDAHDKMFAAQMPDDGAAKPAESMTAAQTASWEAKEAQILADKREAAATVAMGGSTAYRGVGGPIEARTDYPPCRPGPGDDNCIQLYERGVTGRDE